MKVRHNQNTLAAALRAKKFEPFTAGALSGEFYTRQGKKYFVIKSYALVIAAVDIAEDRAYMTDTYGPTVTTKKHLTLVRNALLKAYPDLGQWVQPPKRSFDSFPYELLATLSDTPHEFI